jgi:hypothetical protein
VVLGLFEYRDPTCLRHERCYYNNENAPVFLRWKNHIVAEVAIENDRKRRQIVALPEQPKIHPFLCALVPNLKT